MSSNIDKLFGVHAQALVLRSKRAEVLASNMANVDTPNYKAKDLDFKAALGQAKTSLAANMKRTDAGHLPGVNQTIGDAQMRYRIPLQPSLDGNTVDAQLEKGKFSENAVHYSASLNFLNSRISGLIRVLREE